MRPGPGEDGDAGEEPGHCPSPLDLSPALLHICHNKITPTLLLFIIYYSLMIGYFNLKWLVLIDRWWCTINLGKLNIQIPISVKYSYIDLRGYSSYNIKGIKCHRMKGKIIPYFDIWDWVVKNVWCRKVWCVLWLISWIFNKNLIKVVAGCLTIGPSLIEKCYARAELTTYN